MNIEKLTIVAGTAKITGRITIPESIKKDNIFVTITVPHPISGEHVRYEAIVDQYGKFSMVFDVETDTSFIGLYTSVNPYKTLIVKCFNGNETHIDMAYNSDLDIKNINVKPTMNQNDMSLSMEVLNKMIGYRPDRSPTPLYDKSTDEFLNYTKSIVSERLRIFVDKDTLITKEFKGIVSKEFRLFMYVTFVFDYEEEMIRNYRNVTSDTVNKPEIQKIDRSYFDFLKDLNLNDPQFLQTFTFSEIQNAILRNEVLELPVIGENDITTWLTNVKVILSDLVGFDDGPYYDILVANAFSRQLKDEIQPLTEKQKENIAHYWKDGEIAKILFRKNKEVVELDKVKSPTVVNDIQYVPEENVIETIVSKYKDKVVLIDLWATWCVPCLDAINQLKGTKEAFRDKDIKFVYLTNGSSPKKLWKEKIKGIGDEHYYLKDGQWNYVMKHFGFEAIPSYLLYNKQGVLIHKFTSFPGKSVMKEMINDLLK